MAVWPALGEGAPSTVTGIHISLCAVTFINLFPGHPMSRGTRSENAIRKLLKANLCITFLPSSASNFLKVNYTTSQRLPVVILLS
jgi:hypothetical protein